MQTDTTPQAKIRSGCSNIFSVPGKYLKLLTFQSFALVIALAAQKQRNDKRSRSWIYLYGIGYIPARLPCCYPVSFLFLVGQRLVLNRIHGHRDHSVFLFGFRFAFSSAIALVVLQISGAKSPIGHRNFVCFNRLVMKSHESNGFFLGGREHSPQDAHSTAGEQGRHGRAVQQTFTSWNQTHMTTIKDKKRVKGHEGKGRS